MIGVAKGGKGPYISTMTNEEKQLVIKIRGPGFPRRNNPAGISNL